MRLMRYCFADESSQLHERLRCGLRVKVLAMRTAASGNAMHGEQIIDFLWPDADAESARGELGEVFHACRRVLTPGNSRRQVAADAFGWTGGEK